MALCVLDPEISTQEQLSAAFCIFHIVTYFFFPFWIKRATRERELVTFADTIDLWFVRFTGLGYFQCCFWAVLDCAFYYETSGCDDDQMRRSLP